MSRPFPRVGAWAVCERGAGNNPHYRLGLLVKFHGRWPDLWADMVFVDDSGVDLPGGRWTVSMEMLRQARRSEIPAARLAGVDPGWLDYLGYRD